MRSILSMFFFLTLLNSSFSQDYNPLVEELINETRIDSLVKFTRELTGEDSVMVNGTMSLIQNRLYYQNDLAAEYIKQKLTQFGLIPIEQVYSTDGKNIYAVQEGSVYPDEEYIICAHYDAVADYCADDNASGCAAVLESARLLSQIDFKYTIIYAFWDEEEIGMHGSANFAEQAAQNNEIINSVLNLEMFGWDSNYDMSFDIHTRDIANSEALADLLVSIDSTYELSLEPLIHNPGTTASDHSSFWDQVYTAVVYSEAFFSGDPNPFYHTSNDRIEHFNLSYFHELTKLAVAAISIMADPLVTAVSERDIASGQIQIKNFPNPFHHETTISFNQPEEGNAMISIYDLMGGKIIELSNSIFPAGESKLTFSSPNLENGIYILRFENKYRIAASMMIVQ